MPWLVAKQGDKFCVFKRGENDEPTGEALGCHDSAEDATAQMKALYSNVKEALWVTVEQMEKLCAPCARHMRESNLKRINLVKIKEAGFSQALCDTFGSFEGFRTRCMESSLAEQAEDPGAICNDLKDFCFGKVSEASFYEGGEGSGNFGHAGRPGEIGGSSSGGGGANISELPKDLAGFSKKDIHVATSKFKKKKLKTLRAFQDHVFAAQRSAYNRNDEKKMKQLQVMEEILRQAVESKP